MFVIIENGKLNATEFITGYVAQGFSASTALFVFFLEDKNDDKMIDHMELKKAFAMKDRNSKSTSVKFATTGKSKAQNLAVWLFTPTRLLHRRSWLSLTFMYLVGRFALIIILIFGCYFYDMEF